MSEPLPEHYVGNNARHHRDIGPFRIAIEERRASDGKLWWRWDVECRGALRPTHLAGTGPGTPAPDNEPEARRQAEAFLLTLATSTAAELVQAADEVEPEPEQSCFTCAHDKTETRNGRVTHTCDPADTELEAWVYIEESGAEQALDGMPEDRTIQCPCWSAKVTT